MSRLNIPKLQKFGFRDSGYQRPNDLWVCGRGSTGKPCRQGPFTSGKCGARAECQPRKEGDRWVCARSKSAGGECPCGPTSSGVCSFPVVTCTPKRALRNFRGVVSKWLAVVTIGIVAILLTAPYGLDWLSPGPLTAQHAGIGDCASCHVHQDKSMSHALIKVVTPDDPKGGSAGCVRCHEMGQAPLLAHNVSPQALADMIMSPVSTNSTPLSLSFSRAVFKGPTTPGESIACATCHQEHQGALIDITTMGSDQCQACHTSSFQSFENGHPEFSSYPYRRQTRINFNHQSHFVRHFPKSDTTIRPTDCQDCHETGPRDQLMTTKPFEVVCSDCHLGDITGRVGSGTRNMAFLTVPGLDIETLQDRGVGIGYWPEYAENPITPFMKLLLSADEGLRADISVVESMDLLDLGDADDQTLAAVERVAWGVKSMMQGLLYEGPEMLIEKITMDRTLSHSLVTDMVAALPFDVVQRTVDTWFPVLMQEISQHNQGATVPTRLSLDENVGADDASLTAVDMTVPELSDTGNDDILSEDDILSDDEDILADDEDILGAEDILSNDENILSDNGILAEDDILSDGDGDILGDDDDILGDETDAQTAVVETVEMPTLDMKTWMQYGGWHEQDFSLVYRPTKHSDPFFSSWISASGHASSGELAGLARPVFDLLTTANSAGRCGKCHSIDSNENGDLDVNWLAFFPNKHMRPSTTFSHEQHSAVLRDDGCQNCHKIDAEADYASSYKDHDPKTFASNFKQMEKVICVECHNAKTGVQQCTDCHNYHLGRVALSDMVAPIK